MKWPFGYRRMLIESHEEIRRLALRNMQLIRKILELVAKQEREREAAEDQSHLIVDEPIGKDDLDINFTPPNSTDRIFHYEDMMGIWEAWTDPQGRTAMRRRKRCGHGADYTCVDYIYPTTYEKLPTMDRIIRRDDITLAEVTGPWRSDGTIITDKNYYDPEGF